MAEELERLAEELDFNLCKCNPDQLKAIAEGLNLQYDEQDSKRHLRKVITKWYESMMEDAADDEETAKQLATKLKTLLSEVEKTIGGGTPADTTMASPDDQIAFSNTNKEGKKNEEDGAAATGKNGFDISRLYQDPASVLRKELKIRGQIGEPKAKDKLSYVSLMHQINEAQGNGYKDSEIISAVVRSMTPGLSLRCVLETKSDLDLKTLHQFLEAHYSEKSATELCNQLSSLVQATDESAYAFLIRCIEVRQKLLLASGKAGGVRYDKAFIQQIFYRTVENGLANRHILHDIKPLLCASATDQNLIAEINKLSSAEKERIEIQSRAKSKLVKVNSAQENASEKTLLGLTAAVAKLTEQVNSMMQQQPARRRFRRCTKCVKEDIDPCNHCFKCFSSKHQARNCTENK